MGDFLRVSDQKPWYIRIQVKHHLQLTFIALHGSHGNDIIEEGNDHIWFSRRNQCAFHDLCIVKHIVDLIGQPLTCQFYGFHICPYLIGNIFFQYDFADSKDHINRCPELMRHVGEKFGILTPCLFQLDKSTVKLFP